MKKPLTFKQLKRLVNESETGYNRDGLKAMKPKMKIYTVIIKTGLDYDTVSFRLFEDAVDYCLDKIMQDHREDWAEIQDDARESLEGEETFFYDEDASVAYYINDAELF